MNAIAVTPAERLVPLRALMLKQEQAHHRLGRRWTATASTAEAHAIAAARAGYLVLADAVIDAGVEAFGAFEVDGQHFAATARLRLADLVPIV